MLASECVLQTVLLGILALGSSPTWRYSRRWGYRRSSGFGLLALIPIILIVMGGI